MDSQTDPNTSVVMCWIAAILCNAEDSDDSTRHASQRDAAKETADMMVVAEILFLLIV